MGVTSDDAEWQELRIQLRTAAFNASALDVNRFDRIIRALCDDSAAIERLLALREASLEARRKAALSEVETWVSDRGTR